MDPFERCVPLMLLNLCHAKETIPNTKVEWILSQYLISSKSCHGLICFIFRPWFFLIS